MGVELDPAEVVVLGLEREPPAPVLDVVPLDGQEAPLAVDVRPPEMDQLRETQPGIETEEYHVVDVPALRRPQDPVDVGIRPELWRPGAPGPDELRPADRTWRDDLLRLQETDHQADGREPKIYRAGGSAAGHNIPAARAPDQPLPLDLRAAVRARNPEQVVFEPLVDLGRELGDVLLQDERPKVFHGIEVGPVGGGGPGVRAGPGEEQVYPMGLIYLTQQRRSFLAYNLPTSSGETRNLVP